MRRAVSLLAFALAAVAFAACGPSAAFPCNDATQCPQGQICNIDKAVCIDASACDGCIDKGRCARSASPPSAP